MHTHTGVLPPFPLEGKQEAPWKFHRDTLVVRKARWFRAIMGHSVEKRD